MINMENIILEFQEISELINKKILFTYNDNNTGTIIGVGGETKNILQSIYKEEDFYKENKDDLIIKFDNKPKNKDIMSSIKYNKCDYQNIYIYTLSQYILKIILLL